MLFLGIPESLDKYCFYVEHLWAIAPKSCFLNQFLAKAPILYPLKTPENL